MTTLQAALAALGGTLKVKRAVSTSAPVKRPAGPRVVAEGTFGQHYPLRLASASFEAVGDSRPPPEHEPNFAERYFP